MVLNDILGIYKSDLKGVFKRVTSILMILTLIILPSLYAWFNIDAAWDPYGNTGSIKVAVSNNDAGGTLDIIGKKYNAGDMLIEQLENNDSLEWCFVSEKDARNGVDAGNFYAALIIPEDFTECLLSISNDEIIQSKIKYLVNEKINPVTPIITKKGVETIKYELRKKFVSIVNEMIFKIVSVVGNTAEQSEDKIDGAVDTVHKLNDLMPAIQELINKVDNSELTFNEFEEKANQLFEKVGNTNQTLGKDLEQLGSYLNSINMTINQTTPFIKQALKSGIAMAESYKALINSIEINQSIEDIKKTLIIVRDGLIDFDTKLNSIIKLLEGNNSIEHLKQIEQSVIYISVILDGTITKIDNGEALSADRLNDIKKAVIKSCDLIISLNDGGGTLLNQIDSIFSDTINICNDGTNLFKEIQEILNQVSELKNMFNVGESLNGTNFENIKTKFPIFKEKLADFVKKFDKLNYEDKKQKLAELLQIDLEDESTFLSSPINIDKQILYPIDNYGSEITPFYNSLGLWIGALLLVALTTCKAKNYKKENLSARKEYVGKYLFFITLGILQSLVMTLGEIFILGVDSKHPFLFVMFGVLVSLVFQTIVFTITSCLGAIGKGLSLVVLVLQVAASGGIYPIQVNGYAFKGLSPLLPFTYSIGLYREAIGGITSTLLIKNILLLLLFMIIFLFLGIVFKTIFGRPKNLLEESFEESGL